MKALFILFVFLYFGSNVFAQKSINNYKYIIVPAQFEFLKEKDKYQLNSLTKFLFNKYGYTALINNEQFPNDLANNGCLALYAELEDKRGFLKTKLQFHLKDCKGEIIQSSKVGETKEKLIDKSLHLALRDAFETFRYLNYEYQPTRPNANKETDKIPIPESVEQEFKKDHKETARLIEAINDDSENENSDNNQDSVPSVVVSGIPEINKDASANKEKIPDNNQQVLYAQPIKNGFQVVDTEPKKIMIIYHSGLEDIFIVKGKDAIVYKKDGSWFYSESGEQLKESKLNIKF